MEILIASLLLAWGAVTADHPDVTIDQMVQASIQYEEQQLAAQTPEETSEPGKEGDKRDPQRDAPVIKGVYATAHSAGGARLASLLKLIDDTELNSIVIDVKDDWGYITYPTEDPKLTAMGTSKKIIKNVDQLMTTLDEHDVYPIARIVVFKDTVLAKLKPEWSFKNPDGSIWVNNRKESFVNPYLKEVWEYNVNVAKEAAKLGFKEIQFDYVRFPEGFEKKADKLTYMKDERTRVDAVSEFVQYAREQLYPLGVRVSVDIFGYAASVPAAEGIGQDFVKISNNVDVISPMVYPSHYTAGWFGSKVPDAAPFVTIDGAMKDTHKKLEPLENNQPIIRPWIQDFTATWIKGHVKYGKHEVEEQIRALSENGIHEFLLWNASNVYTQGVDYEK